MTDRLVVNEHYMNRVVAVAEAAGVEATEDILTGNGIKLVAKGARIDGRSKERLLQHKLSKPLETCVRVVDGVGPRPIDKVAEELLDKHALLAGVCGTATARLVVTTLRDLRLSTPMEALLSLYASQGPRKLEHAVGIGLLGAAMFHGLAEGGTCGVHTLLVAGLMHDAGELYIDPAFLETGMRLSAEHWKHIAAHPIVGAHVLRDMPGAGPLVAEAVLYHHERLDGFGYPHGLRGAGVPLSGQVLALAEMLMGLVESGRSPGERAAVAIKLIPGEFNRQLLDRVVKAARMPATAGAAHEESAPLPTVDELAAKVTSLDRTLRHLLGMRPAVLEQIGSRSAALKELMAHVIERCQRICLAFSSTGLDTHGEKELRDRVSAMDPQVHAEIALVLREIEWRLREVKRETRVRLERLSEPEAALVRAFVEQAKGAAREPTAAGAAERS